MSVNTSRVYPLWVKSFVGMWMLVMIQIPLKVRAKGGHPAPLPWDERPAAPLPAIVMAQYTFRGGRASRP